MNCSPNYTEWSREEKEELAKRRMDEMRLKNEKLLQRYAEVENDRIKAESRNSAITGAAKTVKKEKIVSVVESNKEETKVEYDREWDRGKPDMDHWKSPEHHGSSFKNYRSSGRNRRDSDRKDNWGGFSRNENAERSRRGTDDSYEKRNVDRKDSWSGYSRNETTDHYRSDHAPDQRKLRGGYRFKQNDNNQHGSSRPQISPKRTRGVGYRNSDSHRKPQNSYSDDKFRRTDYNRSNSRKKYSYRAHSRSTSRSGSDHVENQFTIRAYNLWQNDKISEDQTKQNRVEKWVKSVNKTNMWGSKEFSPNPKIFAHDVKAKFSSKVPSEQKDKSARSFTKFDRYEATRNKSSEDEYDADLNKGNKSCENSNYASQRDYNETKNQNKGAAYNVGSAKQMGGMKKKGVQTKRSPQYSSGSSTKNENFRKQRRFDGKGQKDDERNRYKSKMHDNTMTTNDSWKNSTLDSTRNQTSSVSKLDNTDTWNQEDDGVWGNTDQSHIKWKLSDEETDVQEIKNQNKKEAETSSDMRDNWNDNQVASDSKRSMSKRQNEGKDKGQVPPDNDDGIWSNVEQSDIRWKTETETFSQDGQNQNWEFNNSNSAVQNTARKETKKETGYGMECEEIDKSNINNSSERKEELITSGQKTCDSDPYEKSNTCKKDNCSGCLRTEMIDEYWSDHVPVPRKLKGRDTLKDANTWNQENDVIWSNTDQSHTKWNIRDEKIDVHKAENQNKKKAAKNSDSWYDTWTDTWNDNKVASDSMRSRSKRQNEGKDKGQVPHYNESDTSKDAYTWNQEDDGLWGNTDQSHIKWNISDEEIDAHEVENQSKKKAANSDSWYDTWTDNWNDNQVVSGSMRSRSKRQNEGKDKHQVPRDNGRNEGNISEYYSNSTARQQNSYAQESYWNEDAIVNSFKCSVYISEGKE